MNKGLMNSLHDPRIKGQDCQSIGKLESIIGHLAFIVNLKINRKKNRKNKILIREFDKKA